MTSFFSSLPHLAERELELGDRGLDLVAHPEDAGTLDVQPRRLAPLLDRAPVQLERPVEVAVAVGEPGLGRRWRAMIEVLISYAYSAWACRSPSVSQLMNNCRSRRR